MGRIGKLRRGASACDRPPGSTRDGTAGLTLLVPRDAADEGVTVDELSLLAGEVDIGPVQVFRRETLLPGVSGRKKRR